MSIESNNKPTQPEQPAYFIFPGLKELLRGTAFIALIEYLTGMSDLALQPLQTIFSAMLAFTLLEIILIAVIVRLTGPYSGVHPFVLLMLPFAVFCSGMYVIGLIFPGLAMVFPAYPAPRLSFLGYLPTEINYLLYASWKVILQLGQTWGWFTIIASWCLLGHIAMRYGTWIRDRWNSI